MESLSAWPYGKGCTDKLYLYPKYSLSICIYNAGFRIKIMIE